jgi:hypothetical protein
MSPRTDVRVSISYFITLARARHSGFRWMATTMVLIDGGIVASNSSAISAKAVLLSIFSSLFAGGFLSYVFNANLKYFGQIYLFLKSF